MAEPMKEKEDLQEVEQNVVETIEPSAKSVEEVASEDVAENEKKEEPVENVTKMKDAGSFVTKVEGFIMFAVMLFMAILCTLTVSTTVVNNADLTNEEIAKLRIRVSELEVQLAEIEDGIKNVKPENFDVNINVGNEGITMSYDAETNTMIPKEETDVSEGIVQGFDTRPFLGVAFAAESTPNPFGLKIDHVYESSPAEEAGLKPGDIIMSLNGVKINVFEDLDAVISSMAAGDELSIEIATTTENGIDCVMKEAILTYRGNFDLED